MKNVIDEDIKKVLENKYLSYAISTIISLIYCVLQLLYGIGGPYFY